MAKATKIALTLATLKAMRGLLRGRKLCPVCKEPINEHIYLVFNPNTGHIIGCSNDEQDW